MGRTLGRTKRQQSEKWEENQEAVRPREEESSRKEFPAGSGAALRSSESKFRREGFGRVEQTK